MNLSAIYLIWVLASGLVGLVAVVRVLRQPAETWKYRNWSKLAWVLAIMYLARLVGGLPIPVGAIAAIGRTRRHPGTPSTSGPLPLAEGSSDWPPPVGHQVNPGSRDDRELPGDRPVIVVLGQADQAFIDGLRGIGLVPVAEDGIAAVWGRALAGNVEARSPSTECQPPGLFMTLVDAALAMGLDRGAIYQLIGRGELDVVRVGGHCRVPFRAVDELKARRAGSRQQDRSVAR